MSFRNDIFSRHFPQNGSFGGGLFNSAPPSQSFNQKSEYLESFYSFYICVLFTTIILIHTAAPVTLILKITNNVTPPGLGAVWYIGGFAGLLLALARPLDSLKASLHSWPFLILFLWAVASITWSVDRTASIKGCILLSLNVTSAIAIAARYSWYQIIKLNALYLTILICVSAFLAIAIPRLGQMQEIYPGAWSGLWMEKQGLGFTSVLQMLFCAILGIYYPKHRKWLLAIPIGLLSVWETESKTAIIMFAIGLGAIIGIRLMQLELKTSLILLVIGIAVAIILGAFIFSNPDLLFKLTGKSKDLTGRTEIWEGIDFLINQRPLKGWGYNVIWDGKENMLSPYQWIADIAGFTPANSHSAYKEALLTQGKVGLYLLAFALIIIAIKGIIYMRLKPVASVAAISIVGSLFVISFTEMVFMAKLDYYWLTVMMLGTKLSMPYNETEKIFEK